MHPYDHARSSARIHGGRVEDYLAVHAWYDATKTVRCHFTHRTLRHHHQGVAENVARFGAGIVNSDGASVSVEELGRQHLSEDCRHQPDAADWLVDMRTPSWMPDAQMDVDELAALSARRYGGVASDHLDLHRWFMATATWCEGPAHLLFRHHAFGIFEAEERFGAVLPLTGGGALPTRVAAERHVHTVVGRIPSADEWLRCLKGERWMLQATSPAKLGLDKAA
jgi:hypothetical protein